MEGVALRDLGIGDMGWLIQAHGELYARDEGFDASFEHLVARVLLDHVECRDPARERAFIAVRGDRRLGSIFCTRGPAEGVAKLRLFLVLPEMRGAGLGRRLLGACLDFARAAGYREMTVRTHESHRAAGALYARSGFAMQAAWPVRSFGRDLVEQSWRRPL